MGKEGWFALFNHPMSRQRLAAEAGALMVYRASSGSAVTRSRNPGNAMRSLL